MSRVVGLGRERIFGAPAIVDDPVNRPRVRLYDVHGTALESVGFAWTVAPNARHRRGSVAGL